MSIFVLVHGSWHDGTLWAGVAGHLAGLGHEVHCPTVAGHGPGADRAVHHDDCVASVVDYLDEHGLDQFVLVGHSWGGSVIARVAERVPDRVRRLVFFSAFVPENGTSVLDNTPQAYRELFPKLAARTTDDTVLLPFDIWRDAFIGDADLARARETYALLTPEPLAPTVEKLDLTTFYSLTGIPRSYLLSTEDCALPPGDPQHGYLANARRLGAFRLVTLDGSHEVMFTNPALLADKLVLAGRD